jgi:biopolymer transport protein ExbD
MSSPAASSSRFTIQTAGLLPTPAILVLVYGFLIFLVYLQTMCSLRFPSAHEFWALPSALNLSLIELFTAINLLAALYLLVSFWAFISKRGGRSIRKVIHWGAYIASFVVLITIHIFVGKMEEAFGLPDEIKELRTTEFHELQPRGLEDLVLPWSGICRGFTKPFEDRVIVNIDRRGNFILNRRDQGRVDEARDTIRSHLIAEIAKTARDPGGKTDLILLVRADKEVPFKYIRDVLEISREKEIGIHKIEMGCLCDLRQRAPEAYAKMKLPYWLPEGKLDIPLLPDVDAQDGDPGEHPETLRIEIIANSESETGFLIRLEGEDLGGAVMPESLRDALRSRDKTAAGFGVFIRTGNEVQYSQVMNVMSACLEAGATGVSFAPAEPEG